MTILTKEQRATGLGPVAALPLETEVEEPSFFTETFPAAFRLDSPPVTLSTRLAVDDESDVPDPMHNPLEGIEGTVYEDFQESFVNSVNATQTASTKLNIDRQIIDRQTIAASGWKGIAATFVAGIFDPINFVPVGGAAYRSATLGKSVLEGAARTGFAGFLGSTASELVLASAQETRTGGEVAANITASTFLSGIIGSAAAGLSVPRRAALIKEIERDFQLQPAVGGGIGIEDLPSGKAPLEHVSGKAHGAELTNELVGAFGVEKAAAAMRLSPTTRILTQSINNTARDTIERLAEIPPVLKKNLRGEATKQSAEAKTLQYQAPHAQVIKEYDRLFVAYTRRLRGKTAAAAGRSDIMNRAESTLTYFRGLGERRNPDAPMSRKAFREEVGWAARRKDRHAVPEVEEAARFRRSRLIDPIKNEAIGVNILHPDVDPKGASSYLTRVYKTELIAKDPDNKFRNILTLNVGNEFPKLKPAQVDERVDEIIRHILGTPGGRISYGPVEFRAGPAQKRTLAFIKDESIEEFLESDVSIIDDLYVRSMASDIELMREFGAIKFEDSKAYTDIIKENSALTKAASPSDRLKILKKQAKDLKDIGSVWTIIRGAFASTAHTPADSPLFRAGRLARAEAYLAFGGGFMINALPDAGRIAQKEGLIRTFGLPLKALSSGSNRHILKMGKRELDLAAVTLEVSLDTRGMSMADVGSDIRSKTAFERGVNSLTRNFSLMIGLSPYNQLMKTWGGQLMHSRLLSAVDDISKGKRVAKNDALDLAKLGIGKEHIKEIADQIALHSKKEGKLWTSNTEAWERGAQQRFRIALRQGVEQMIVTPRAGDRPPLMSTEMGGLIGQFQSFGFGAVNRALIPSLQSADISTLNGFGVMLGAGYLVYAINQKLAGLPIATDMDTIVGESMDRSGAFGFFANIHNSMDVLTGGTVSLRQLTGSPIPSRYAQRNHLGALLGPTFGLAGSASQLLGTVGKGEFTASDTRTLRRMLPYQRVWYLRGLFDSAEEHFNKQLGIRDRRKNRRRR